MRPALGGFAAPLLACVLFAVILVQTRAALRVSGTWARVAPPAPTAAMDPYGPLDRLIAGAAGSPSPSPERDPFALGPVAGVVAPPHAVRRPVVPAPPPRPVLTSIVWDYDPRATIRWGGREYSVRENTLFADFRVAGISRDQVVLERGGERFVLALPKKGE